MALGPNIQNFADKFGEIIEEMMDDPNMWLVRSIEEAKEDDRNHELVILLNIFFESLISTWLEERWQEKDLAEKEEEWLDKDYHHKLRLARDLEMITDSKFHLLNLLKDSRNFYAHNIKALHPDEKSSIEEEGKLEEAYELYDNIPIGKTLSLE